jgi:zinc transporter
MEWHPVALFRLVSRPPDSLREEDAQSLRQCAEQFSLELRDTAFRRTGFASS